MFFSHCYFGFLLCQINSWSGWHVQLCWHGGREENTESSRLHWVTWGASDGFVCTIFHLTSTCLKCMVVTLHLAPFTTALLQRRHLHRENSVSLQISMRFCILIPTFWCTPTLLESCTMQGTAPQRDSGTAHAPLLPTPFHQHPHTGAPTRRPNPEGEQRPEDATVTRAHVVSAASANISHSRCPSLAPRATWSAFSLLRPQDKWFK